MRFELWTTIASSTRRPRADAVDVPASSARWTSDACIVSPMFTARPLIVRLARGRVEQRIATVPQVVGAAAGRCDDAPRSQLRRLACRRSSSLGTPATACRLRCLLRCLAEHVARHRRQLPRQDRDSASARHAAAAVLDAEGRGRRAMDSGSPLVRPGQVSPGTRPCASCGVRPVRASGFAPPGS